MGTIRNTLFLIIVLVLASLLAGPFGNLYRFVFETYGAASFSSFFASAEDYTFFDGLFPSYVLLLVVAFTAWGAGKRAKYWWMGVLLLPALAFVIYFDLSRIWFYILLGLIGWGIGLALQKFIRKSKKQP